MATLAHFISLKAPEIVLFESLLQSILLLPLALSTDISSISFSDHIIISGHGLVNHTDVESLNEGPGEAWLTFEDLWSNRSLPDMKK